MESSANQSDADLLREKAELRSKHAASMQYIRRKVDQLLTMMGTAPLRPEELDDDTLIELDPIGIISDSFAQVLRHLKGTNEQLKVAHDEITAIFDSAGMGILVIDRDMRVLAANRQVQEQFGRDRPLTIGMRCHELICRHDPDPECPAVKAIDAGASARRETDLNDRHFDVVATPIADEAGSIAQVVLVYMDLTDRIRAETAMAAEREQLAVTLRSIGDGVITTDINGNVVLINKVAERLTGWRQSEARGRTIRELFPVKDERTGQDRGCPIEQVLRLGKPCELEGNAILVARDGSRHLITDSVAPILDKDSAVSGAVLVFRDITERKKLEDRLIKSEKIESLGVLAGGIAHDFNNLLNSIIANIDIAMRFAAPDSDQQRGLARAQKASGKAKELTQQLLTFSKGGAPVKKLASIADLIRDTGDFGTRGTSVRCEYELPADLWNAEVDEGQISQVIQNLVINAVQAMPRGGTIRISASNIEAGRMTSPSLREGRYVAISIRDQGHGIAPENLNRIFEPYFTTKPAGSGLGLATTYSIIKNHDGVIDVESALGTGTTFSVYLPASQAAAAPDEHRAKPLPRKSAGGRILVMDDDELIRETVGVLLDMLGYRADVADDGDQALTMYRQAKQSGAPYDAVIMDLTIPGGKGGKEAIQDLLDIDPRAKAIVSSGYSTDAVMANYAQHGFAGIVVKPYTVDELGAELQRVLGRL
ncbi:MAG: hybrid sensor histidine kinase/response regulator [Nitrospirota bacterium]